jgi:hypothetical protein
MFVLSLNYVDIIYAALFFLFYRPCAIPDGDKLLRIKTASISLMDIPSYSNSSKTLGSESIKTSEKTKEPKVLDELL